MIGAPRRIFVADDHALFRQGVKALLAEEPDLAVAGEAGTVLTTPGKSAGAGALTLQPPMHMESSAAVPIHRKP